MNLNSNHIIEFIMQRWKLTKAEIAKALNYEPPKLSRKTPIIFDNIPFVYERFFNVENESSEAYSKGDRDSKLILRALKDFLTTPENKEDLDVIWENRNYTEIIMELLRSANMQPFKEKSSYKKKEVKAEKEILQSITLKDSSKNILLDEVQRLENKVDDLENKIQELDFDGIDGGLIT